MDAFPARLFIADFVTMWAAGAATAPVTFLLRTQTCLGELLQALEEILVITFMVSVRELILAFQKGDSFALGLILHLYELVVVLNFGIEVVSGVSHGDSGGLRGPEHGDGRQDSCTVELQSHL